MLSSSFENAGIAYNSGDYNGALEAYQRCLEEDKARFEPGEEGMVYHRLGNCLVKTNRYEEAVAVFKMALGDPAYHERGSLHVNLGTALTAAESYDEAIEQFRLALDDSTYEAPYRAWMGMGNALSRQGRIVEAGTAYRTAALDDG
ncbi:MAG: tetratricopeptide repeat protein, partial [Coriobacteriia bacterium]|nr:tetratricopeptide repeat protein [Coriobacteriia bacterium]